MLRSLYTVPSNDDTAVDDVASYTSPFVDSWKSISTFLKSLSSIKNTINTTTLMNKRLKSGIATIKNASSGSSGDSKNDNLVKNMVVSELNSGIITEDTPTLVTLKTLLSSINHVVESLEKEGGGEEDDETKGEIGAKIDLWKRLKGVVEDCLNA
jgi:hypothetical protein